MFKEFAVLRSDDNDRSDGANNRNCVTTVHFQQPQPPCNFKFKTATVANFNDNRIQ